MCSSLQFYGVPLLYSFLRDLGNESVSRDRPHPLFALYANTRTLNGQINTYLCRHVFTGNYVIVSRSIRKITMIYPDLYLCVHNFTCTPTPSSPRLTHTRFIAWYIARTVTVNKILVNQVSGFCYASMSWEDKWTADDWFPHFRCYRFPIKFSLSYLRCIPSKINCEFQHQRFLQFFCFSISIWNIVRFDDVTLNKVFILYISYLERFMAIVLQILLSRSSLVKSNVARFVHDLRFDLPIFFFRRRAIIQENVSK